MLDEKICLVTGSASGIGRATAIEMGRQGAGGVVVSDVNDEGGEETVALVEEAGGSAIYVRCDVSRPDQLRALVDAAVREFGGLDVLHNNAGVNESMFTQVGLTVDELPEDVWEKVYAIDLRSVWLATKYASPHLRASTRDAAIVNAASTAGLTAYEQCPAYGPMKAAVIMLTQNTALDLAPDVRCNCYSPASVRTGMVESFRAAADDVEGLERATLSTHLIPRYGDPAEIAKAVCFLASAQASWITGANLGIDGGVMAWRGSHSV